MNIKEMKTAMAQGKTLVAHNRYIAYFDPDHIHGPYVIRDLDGAIRPFLFDWKIKEELNVVTDRLQLLAILDKMIRKKIFFLVRYNGGGWELPFHLNDDPRNYEYVTYVPKSAKLFGEPKKFISEMLADDYEF